MIDEQSSTSGQDYASDHSAIGAGLRTLGRGYAGVGVRAQNTGSVGKPV